MAALACWRMSSSCSIRWTKRTLAATQHTEVLEFRANGLNRQRSVSYERFSGKYPSHFVNARNDSTLGTRDFSVGMCAH